MDTSAARAEVLRRIRGAVGPGAAPEAVERAWERIARPYRQTDSADREAMLGLLEDRLRDYDAGVYRCAESEVAETIAGVLRERGKQLLAVPEGLPAGWLPEGVAVVRDDRDGVARVDGCEGVLTSATVAIAETGTIVLQDVAGQGRRALTLLPDYHLCVVPAGCVVGSVPEAMARLQATASLATTFFSGPSATADIEMTRIKGVHGPRFVDVVLIV